MDPEHYCLLGLAGGRSQWFGDVGRWATAAAIPVDFVRCVSAEELRARLAGGRNYSMAVLDSRVPGLDRDLIDAVNRAGVPTVVVDDGPGLRDWTALGAVSTLNPGFDRDELMAVLATHGQPVRLTTPRTEGLSPRPAERSMGQLVAVTGASGAGSSTLAMALGQGLAAQPHLAGRTLVADLALEADMAMLHDARDIVPGVQELVDAHRTGVPDERRVRGLVFDVTDRGYHLLLGLRRHRDWSVLRPRAFASALDSLLGVYGVVVADVEPDLEGEEEVGSIDVEERNLMARSTVDRADIVIAVGSTSVKGIHRLLRVVADLLAFGVAPRAIVPVLNFSTRSARHRAAATAAFGELVAHLSDHVATPVHVPERRGLDETTRDGARLPQQVVKPVTSAILPLLESLEPKGPRAVTGEPIPVVPGTLGTLYQGEEQP